MDREPPRELLPYEAGALLGKPEQAILNALRRGQYLESRGRSHAEIESRGALPVAWVAGDRRVSAEVVARCLADEPLARAMLDALLAGRFVPTRPRRKTDAPRPLTSFLENL
jgi:hypothetical protein